MSALGDRLRETVTHVLDWPTPPGDVAQGYVQGLEQAAGFADEHEAAALAESAQGRGPHAALAARAFAQRLRESVPEDVFTPNGTTVDAHSARLRRVDADLLDHWADEAEQPPPPRVDFLGPTDDEPPVPVLR